MHMHMHMHMHYACMQEKSERSGRYLVELLRAAQRVQPVLILSGDAHYSEHRFIDYVAFCGDIEPKANGRDLDHQERVLANDWLTKVPEKSVCVQVLEGEVSGVRRRQTAGGCGADAHGWHRQARGTQPPREADGDVTLRLCNRAHRVGCRGVV